jgi:SSS family transporter
VVMLYITQGGFTAVVWSDVFQGSLMLIGLVALPWVALNHIGGLEEVTTSLRAIDPHLLSLHGPGTAGPETGSWNVSSIVKILGMAAIGIGFLGSPQVFVRYISMKNEKQILPGMITAGIWTVLADSGAVLVGVFGRAIYSSEALRGNADNVLPEMAQGLLPAFFAGLFIAMVLSAIMSTIDSLIVVASSAVVRDYWQKIKNPSMSDQRLMALTRKVTISLSLVSFCVGIGMMLVDKENPVFWVIIFGWSGIAATFCPTIILSLCWSKLTALGAKCAMVAGFLGVPLFKFVVPGFLSETWSGYLESLDVLLPSFLVGFVVAVVVSLLDEQGQKRMEGIEEELKGI